MTSENTTVSQPYIPPALASIAAALIGAHVGKVGLANVTPDAITRAAEVAHELYAALETK